MKKTLSERICIFLAITLALFMFLPGRNVSAMHIMEGYLSPVWCISWFALCIPFIVAGFFSIKRSLKENRKNITLLAMSGAFMFVLSALNLPSVTGSCSHPTGVGVGSVLFGSSAMSILGTIVLLFQAFLLAHGGLTTLGANVYSMAIVGPFVAFGVYKLVRKLGGGLGIGVFFAAFAGDLATYIVTSFQLALAFPDPTAGFLFSLGKFMGIFALTQIPIAVCEGLLTVVIFNLLAKYSNKELKALGLV